MAFEFHLPSLEEMRATSAGMEMLRMIDDDNFRSALIKGVPGSGKTTVAIQRLVRLNAQQKKVHFVTYQNLLVLAIRNLVQGLKVPDSRVTTLNMWYKQHTGSGYIPSTASQINSCLDHTDLVNGGLDEILIDEGQDLPICVYEAVPHYAKRCFVGADKNQQVHADGAGEDQIAELLARNFPPYKLFPLGQNFRNTYETYRFARQFIPPKNFVAWDENILGRLQNRRGPKPTVITYLDKRIRNEHFRTILENAQGNVAILCPLGGYNDGINESVDQFHAFVTELKFQNGTDVKATRYRNGIDIPNNLERIVVTTFISAKGLEFDTVIIPRINFKKMIPEEWYVACTRASRRLYIYRDLGTPQCDPIALLATDTYDLIALGAVPKVKLDELPF